MAAMDPDQVLVDDITILLLKRGQEIRRANARVIHKADTREPAKSRREGNAFQSELAGDVDVGEGWRSVGVDAVVSQAEFVDECRREGVDFTDRSAAIRIVLVAGREPSAIQKVCERTGREDRLIFVAEAHKEVVVVGESVIDADIEIVLIE